MKKIFKFLAFTFTLLFVLPFIPFTGIKNLSVSNAESTQDIENYVSQILDFNNFKNKVDAILNDYIKFDERIAGSDGEKLAADYIVDFMKSQTNLVPKRTTVVKNGIQNFEFLSEMTGVYESSQNIIFDYNVEGESKTIILGCSYDAYAYVYNEETFNYEYKGVEGVNNSAGSVALLLAIASEIQNLNLNYNVEIVFFGAGDFDNAGSSFFVQGISKDEAKNILCMINFDNIALGENSYFYINETSNKFSDFVNKTVKNNEINIKEVDTTHLNKTLLAKPNELGIKYKHIAMSSDNYNFMKSNILSINFFAGNYSNGIVMGRSEYADADVITYTLDDNLNYIIENYEENAIEKNLYSVYLTINNILTDSDFISVLKASQNSNNLFYSFFGNEKLVIFLTVIAFVIMIVVAMLIHFNLTKKSYYANLEIGFLSSVIKISEHISDGESNEDVAKVVSQVIAQDIKKNKTIKRKRKKD